MKHHNTHSIIAAIILMQLAVVSVAAVIWWGCCDATKGRQKLQKTAALRDALAKSRQQLRDMALIKAVGDGDVPAATRMLDEGADPNSRDDDQVTALTTAADNGNDDIARLLLEKGADPNLPGDYGTPPLTIAAEFGDLELVKLLLDHGANPAYRDAEMAQRTANGNDNSALYAAKHELMQEGDRDGGDLRQIVALLEQACNGRR